MLVNELLVFLLVGFILENSNAGYQLPAVCIKFDICLQYAYVCLIHIFVEF